MINKSSIFDPGKKTRRFHINIANQLWMHFLINCMKKNKWEKNGSTGGTRSASRRITATCSFFIYHFLNNQEEPYL
ncbi:MAG: hypothetical protein KGY75_02740 [Candidatus Cloacimonetes bacterium]|nr:hypothetical protein [Candidatus Cloacimonadota bacterium]MBS3767024.1 hypothetical protein [Candidatus Cloacimonadota bacterium]